MQLLTDIQTISPSIPVFMLDGITHLVHKMGKVLLSDALSLHDVLFFPSFKFNLLLEQLQWESLKKECQMSFCNSEQCFNTYEQYFVPMIGVKMRCHFNNSMFFIKKYN